MGERYTTQSTVGYNATPPPDDGTQVASNEITWAKHKTKLGDPLKVLSDDINTALLAALDESIIDTAINITTNSTHHIRTLNITASATVSLGDATALGVGYIVTVKNSHTAGNTVDLVTGADTLDGVAAGSLILAPNQIATFVINAAASGYLIKNSASYGKKGADIASATALILGTDGDYFDVTGTATITSIGTFGLGSVIKLHFDDILILTHNATDLILPGAINITTAAGDEAEFVEYASGDWRCTNFQQAAAIPLKTKVIDIGDWDMFNGTGTATVSVAHNLTLANIRNLSCLIRNDADTLYQMLVREKTGMTGEGFVEADATNVVLTRSGGSDFDSTAYDSTSFNRGWITIQHI